MREAAKRAGNFVVVSLAHGRFAEGRARAFPHRTMKAAFRTLGSVCSSSRGKLHRHGDFAAAIVTPDNRVMNWHEVKQALEEG